MSDTTRIGHMGDLPLQIDRTLGWATLRAAGDVVLLDGTYALVSAADVEFATRHPEIFSSAKAFEALGSPLPLIPIASDPPDHARYRRILDNYFSPRHMAEREPELREQVGALIDAIGRDGPNCDVVTALANPFPTQVFLTLFGLPLEDRDRLITWKDAVLEAIDPASTAPTDAVLEHALALYSYLQEHVTRRRSDGGTDLLSQLINHREEGGMSDEEIIGLCFLFVLAGLDTVTSAVGFSFAILGREPALRLRLRTDEASIPGFIEEILRFEGPVPLAPRVTTREVTVGGVVIPEGAAVRLMYGAAGRDPERTDEPDRFDIDRETNRHFAFGGGAHRCLGSHLARLELRLILEEWHRRIADYELAPDAQPRAHWPAGTLALSSVPLVLRGAQ